MFFGLVTLIPHFTYVHLRWLTPLVSHLILARIVAFRCTGLKSLIAALIGSSDPGRALGLEA